MKTKPQNYLQITFINKHISVSEILVLRQKLPVDLHVTLSHIIAGACHLDSLLPYFILHDYFIVISFWFFSGILQFQKMLS
jgi:hypothetical protein